MARLSCCLLLSLAVLLPGQAEAWEWWELFKAGQCCSPDGDESDEAESGLIQHQEGCIEEVDETDDQQDEDIEDYQNYPQLLLMRMPEELQSMFAEANITAELLGHVCKDKNICSSLNQLIREMARFATTEQQKHHQWLRVIISTMSLFGGAINRIAAYPGLAAIFHLLGVPSPAAEILAGIITGGGLLSSNMLAVSGANTIRCEGFRNIHDVEVAILAGAATGVDCGMAYKGLTAISNSPALGGVGIVFMAVGLFPLLSNKVETLPDVMRGRNHAAEELTRRVVLMLGQLLHSMKAGGVGLGRNQLQDRMRIYQTLLGTNGSKSCWRWLLRQCCLYSPEDQMKNTARLLCESGVLDGELDGQLSIPELLHQRAMSQRRSTAGTLANAGLLIISAGPAMVYVFADSSSLTALVERELIGSFECQSSGETAEYVLLQGEALVLMLSKGMASAQNGANNVRRFYTWIKGCCCQNGEPTQYSDYALNALGACMALLYGANNIGTMAGNILSSPCLSGGGVALYILPAMAGLGGYGFNAGSGPDLKKIPTTFKEFFQWARSCASDTCPLPDQGVINLIHQLQSGQVELPTDEEVENLEDWLGQHGAAGGNLLLLQSYLSNFQGYESLAINEARSLTVSTVSTGYGSTDESYETEAAGPPGEQTDVTWLLAQGLPLNLLNVVGMADDGNVNEQQKSFLKKLSELIRSRSFIIHSVQRDGYCLYRVLIEMFQLQGVSARQLKKRLMGKLKKILTNRNLTAAEQRFFKKMSLQELAQLLWDLQTGAHTHLSVLQLAALELEADIVFIQNDLGNVLIQQIPHHNPAEPVVIHEDDITGPVALQNSVGHWLWMEPGTAPVGTVFFGAADEFVMINMDGNSNDNNNIVNPNSSNGTVEVLTMELNVGTIGVLSGWMQ